MKKIEILDSTLRDGAQGEGISFSVQDKLHICEALDELGVTYIEAGNPGSNPKDIEFLGVIEPLKELFKDEVREVGEKLGIPKELVWRQPFPGPGLGIRIIGEVTKEKIKILQEADAILRDEMHQNGYEKNLSQFFCVLPGVNSVGVKGDYRTYENLVIIRAITTDDFMTADWAKIPYEILQKISSRITNECKGINRVVYDITSKPPATVEYE